MLKPTASDANFHGDVVACTGHLIGLDLVPEASLFISTMLFCFRHDFHQQPVRDLVVRNCNCGEAAPVYHQFYLHKSCEEDHVGKMRGDPSFWSGLYANFQDSRRPSCVTWLSLKHRLACSYRKYQLPRADRSNYLCALCEGTPLRGGRIQLRLMIPTIRRPREYVYCNVVRTIPSNSLYNSLIQSTYEEQPEAKQL